MGKNLDYYQRLTYSTEIVREEDGAVVAFHPQLAGCVAQGETADEALVNLDEARAEWLEFRLAEGLPIPEPPDENYGGKVLVRMMPALHAAIARTATRQGVSINQFIIATLAEAVGVARGAEQRVLASEQTREWSAITDNLRAALEALNASTSAPSLVGVRRSHGNPTLTNEPASLPLRQNQAEHVAA